MVNRMNRGGKELLYQVDERGNRRLVRSEEAVVPVHLQFTNRTGRPVDVYWRDYRGRQSFYAKVEPGASYGVDSYLTHPWEFLDSNTLERYVVLNRPLFRAPARLGGRAQRMNFNITVPLRSLREGALLTLARSLRSERAAGRLGLPAVLATEVHETYTILKQRGPNE